MKKLFSLLFMMTLFTLNSFSQSANPDTVCIGAIGEQYWVTPTVGSTYDWTINSGGGTITSGQGTDAITVDWGNTSGLFPIAITVIETNSAGCTDTTTLDVFIQEPTVTPIGPFCEGDPCVALVGTPSGGVWSGTGVVLNGGIYEFCPTTSGSGSFTLTYDINGCTVDMTVDVNAAPNVGPIQHN